MNKAILKSESPKRCEQIASGKCTVLLSKTAPKLDIPFKCYIYCTKERTQHKHIVAGKEYRKPTRDFLCKIPKKYGGKVCFIEPPIVNEDYQQGILNGKVIGEFVCDEIVPIMSFCSEPNAIKPHALPFIGMTDKEVIDYLGNGKEGYGLHISQLKIYNTPKELGEFRRRCNNECLNTRKKVKCPKIIEIATTGVFRCNNTVPITRPPQSWCYVEELDV